MKVTSRNASDAAGSPERAIEPSAEEMESRKDAVMEQRRDLFDRRTRLSLDVELGVPGAREVYDRLGQELKAVDERIALLYSASGEVAGLRCAGVSVSGACNDIRPRARRRARDRPADAGAN